MSIVAKQLTIVAIATASACLGLGCGGSSSPAGPDAGAGVTIGNGAPACQGSTVADQEADVGPALPDEIGDPAMARITPPSYPFKVTSISYRLTGMEATCATNIAHAVSVFAASSGTMPAAMPTDVQKIAVAASATDQQTLVVTETLPTPIVLTAGQDLYVAVEMDANDAKTVAVCLDGCHIGADDSRDFWSEQPAAPFTWATLYSFGIAVDYAIWATGESQ